MKKIINIYLLAITIALHSCDSDFLTQDNPVATTEDKWWKTQGQLDQALAGIYNNLPQGGYAGNPNTRVFFAALTDDAIWNGNFYGQLNTMAMGDGTPNTGWPFQGVWERDYQAIRMASRFILNAGQAYMDRELNTRYIAEARALRAWYHLELFMYFGEVPIVSTPITPAEAPEMTKNNRDELIAFIASELDIAMQDLPLTYNVDQAYRMSRGACIAMKAVLYLHAKMYPEAIAMAREITGLGIYELYDDGDFPYRDLFGYAGKFNNERIILKNRPMNDIFFRNAPQAISRSTTQASTNPTAAHVNSYETKQGKTIHELGADSVAAYESNPNHNNNRDPRLSVNVFYRGATLADNVVLDPFDNNVDNPNRIGAVFSSMTGFWCRKYIDYVDAGNVEGSTLDLMLIRLADILLIEVEALVESGEWQHPNVIGNLNQIRNRAGMPNVDTGLYNTQEKLRELYRRERRVELAFEGSRWFDIRRWGIGEQVMNGQVYGATDPVTKRASVVQVRRFDSARDDRWPIPQNEINTTKITQNPNW